MIDVGREEDVTRMCMLRAGAELFGIDTCEICEVLGETRSRPVPLTPRYIDGVVPYRGAVLTTVNFRALLGLERNAGTNWVLVLNDSDANERFGLVVDTIGGLVAFAKSTMETNPASLDARSGALFDGLYRSDLGLIVRLDARQLTPSRLAAVGTYGPNRYGRGGRTE